MGKIMAEVKIYNQDCIAAMNNIDADSVDLIVTDPPYNLGNFMKNRDTMKAVPVTAWRTSNISLPERNRSVNINITRLRKLC